MDVTIDRRRALTKGERTRERLLRAAVQRFGTQGFRATSVSQLSRDAGLTPAAAYAYFPDKTAIWAAAVTADLDVLDGEIRDRSMSSSRPLFDLMVGLVRGLDAHPLARRVLAEGSRKDLQLVLQHALFAGTTEFMARVLRVRQEHGSLSPDADPEQLATGIETVMFSLVVSAVRAGLDDDPERIEAVVALLRAAVGGGPAPTEVPGRPSTTSA